MRAATGRGLSLCHQRRPSVGCPFASGTGSEIDAVVANPTHPSAFAATHSTSTLNCGREKPETIIKVEAGGGSPT
jgi:hypothetical protein